MDSKAFRFERSLLCIWQIHYTQLLTEWAAKINDEATESQIHKTRVISSPLPPCHSMSHWSSCHVCHSWPSKGRRWTWPSWQSSSGCQCRNPYSNALCRSLTPSSDCCVDTWTNNYLIKCVLLSELAWIVIVIWCIWHCHSHADEVWTDSTSGSVQLPWEINIIHKQNLRLLPGFFLFISTLVSPAVGRSVSYGGRWTEKRSLSLSCDTFSQ